jgi:hypothetical protein
LAALATVVAGVLIGAPAVRAQAGAPGLTVVAVHPLSGGEFHFIVALVDGNGAPLTGATVTATPTSPSGSSGAAVALPASDDGSYQGSLSLPEDGTWMVHITSADPTAVFDYSYAVTGDSGTPVGGATPPVVTTAPLATSATEPPATAAPQIAPTSTTASPEPGTTELAAPADDNDDDSGFPVVLLIVGAALVVTLAGVPLALRTIRNVDHAGPADPPSGTSDTGG